MYNASITQFHGETMRLLCTLLTTLSVAGCSADGTLGREGSPAWKMQKTKAEQKAHWLGVCRDYGFKPDTDAMAQCIQKESRGGGSSSADARLDALENARRTECILGGGAYGGGICF